MASTSENTNIQKLLEAEKKAQKIVNDAREARAERMKAAKQEAENEISAYRAELEEEFKAKASKESSASGSIFNTLDNDTTEQIDSIRAQLPEKQKAAIELLVGHVINVDLKA